MNKRQTRSVELLLFLFVVFLVGPLVHEYRAQQASRYALTAAIWDDHTVELTGYTDVLGIDRAVRDGRTYSDKAPLQPMLAVPFYAVYRAVGGEPALTLRVHENLGLWWVTLWMSAVPLGLLTVLMYRYAGRYSNAALPAAAAFALATMMLPFGAVLFGHELAALFLFSSFYLITNAHLSPPRALASGLAAGAAVATEYTALIGVVVICVLILWQRRRRIGWFVLGGLPSVALLAWYHTIAFGSPLSHPYRYSAFNGVVTEAKGVVSMFHAVHPERILQVFFAGRGFLVASPVVVLALVGTVLLIRDKAPERRLAGWAALLMFLGFLGVVVMWGNPWGGESPGPRYMMPAIPFLVVGLAVVWNRLALLNRVAFALGALTMGLATLTDPLITREVGGGLTQWMQKAISGEFVPTIFTIVIGPAGWLIYFAPVAYLGYRLVQARRIELGHTH
jgi:hypothetical protein